MNFLSKLSVMSSFSSLCIIVVLTQQLSAHNNLATEQVIDQPQGIVTLFAHGLGGTRNHGHSYRKYDLFFNDSRIPQENQLHVFDFQDSHALANPLPSCLAQDADIKKLKEEYDKLVAQGYQVILHGVSRGAATIFNFLAIHQPKNVRCAVLESPFDDVATVVHHQLTGIKHIPLIGTLAGKVATSLICFLPLYKNYRIYGVSPRTVAQKVPCDIPLLFIACKKDELIPYTSTQTLAELRQQAGHTHCYLLIVDHGSHANILNDSDGKKVIESIQQFVANPTTNPFATSVA